MLPHQPQTSFPYFNICIYIYDTKIRLQLVKDNQTFDQMMHFVSNNHIICFYYICFFTQ